MKKTYQVYILFSFILVNNYLLAQNFVPFMPRYNNTVKGDMIIIGNNILNRNLSPQTPNDAYNGTNHNATFDMQYVDIDGDPSTFSSSSADLIIPSTTSCNKIKYAGLYWGATLQSGSRTDINKVKLKLPSSNYVDITGQIIYDANLTPIGSASSKPYICYKDVTNLITYLSNPNGTYTIANVISSLGSNGSIGLSAGWTLFIVYEDPSLPRKNITSFDGFSGISGLSSVLDIPMSGIQTIPNGAVKTNFAFASLEGDTSITGDFLKINGSTITTPDRASNNFFNSKISSTTVRNPNSTNTLGIDAAVININNPLNSVISNNQTSAIVRLGDNNDVYFYYFNAFANEIIEPNIVLTTTIKNIEGIDINNTNVNLCQNLQYVISYQNTGNDAVNNLTIQNTLSSNLNFNPLTDLILPPGVTYSYDTGTRKLIFTIPNNQVIVGSPIFEIKIKIQVACSCPEFKDACSNKIYNQSFAYYSGVINSSSYTSSSSNNSSFDICAPLNQPTLVTANVAICDFASSTKLCDVLGVTLIAGNSYESYEWSGPLPSTDVISSTQSVVVNQTGVYRVRNNSTTCQSIIENFTVDVCIPSNIVSQNGNRLFAEENNATYQWIDCNNGNSPIIGETNQFFEPTSSGNYAVIVTNGIGNSSTSNCMSFTFLGTDNFEITNFSIYPNPVKDKIKIDITENISEMIVTNILGQKIEINSSANNEFDISELRSGNYIIQFLIGNKMFFSKIIKE